MLGCCRGTGWGADDRAGVEAGRTPLPALLVSDVDG